MPDTPLHIPKSKEFPGLHVYCSRCDSLVKDVCKLSELPIKQCKFGGHHRYKAIIHVPGTANARKTKNLGRDYHEAVKEVIKLRETIQGNQREVIHHLPTALAPSAPSPPEPQPPVVGKEYKLLPCMARYLRFLSADPELVPEFKRRRRGSLHVSDVARMFKYFAKAAHDKGVDVHELSVGEVNNDLIGAYHDFLLYTQKLSNRSYNRAFSIFFSFFKYLQNEEDYPGKNPFQSIPKRPVVTDPAAVEEDEYLRLLEIVQKPELGIQTLRTGERKNNYKPWMRDAIEIGALSGRRNEEVAMLLWKDVHMDDAYARVPDFKVTRQRGIEPGDETTTKYILIPITDEFKECLFRLGYERYKDTDKYVLAPEETMSRQSIKRFLTRSFTHYYKQLNTGRKLTFKNLRKLYMSHLKLYLSDRTHEVSGHSGEQILDSSYVDKRVIIRKTAREFGVFKKPNKDNEQGLDK